MEIKDCIDEIVRMEERKRELAEQIAECKAAAKSEGFNVTAINRAVKLRLETDAQRQKREAAEQEAEMYEAGASAWRKPTRDEMVEAKTAARVADERRRVEPMSVAARGLTLEQEARMFGKSCDDVMKGYPIDDDAHDADGVVIEAEPDRLERQVSSGGLGAALSSALGVDVVIAPARKPTDADLEECN